LYLDRTVCESLEELPTKLAEKGEATAPFGGADRGAVDGRSRRSLKNGRFTDPPSTVRNHQTPSSLLLPTSSRGSGSDALLARSLGFTEVERRGKGAPIWCDLSTGRGK
jgi:hypothetical protein